MSEVISPWQRQRRQSRTSGWHLATGPGTGPTLYLPLPTLLATHPHFLYVFFLRYFSGDSARLAADLGGRTSTFHTPLLLETGRLSASPLPTLNKLLPVVYSTSFSRRRSLNVATSVSSSSFLLVGLSLSTSLEKQAQLFESLL